MAANLRALRVERSSPAPERPAGGFIAGDSPAMKRLVDLAARIGPRDITVLVRGETGTGKELIATMLHACSKRASAPLVRFNCAAIPAQLAESELFGHARGAFTGAAEGHRGFFAQADGGTLVLDEVGELPAAVQAKLLRALQEGEIQPVGTGRVERVDVRVVACTNRDLATEAEAGRFRMDLYYRLAVVELLVPPLRNHREDIPELAGEFVRRYGAQFKIEPPSMTAELIELLQRADWPGNVRQLQNTIARMVAMNTDGTLDANDFADAVAQKGASPAAQPATHQQSSLREQVEALERALIGRTLTAAGGNRSEAARRLGLSRATLIERLKKWTQDRVPAPAVVP